MVDFSFSSLCIYLSPTLENRYFLNSFEVYFHHVFHSRFQNNANFQSNDSRSVDLYGRTPYTLQWCFSKCWIVESTPVGAWVLLKLYISSSPILTIHCSLWTNHSLQPLKTCNYHHHTCSTQQLFYEVGIICFSLFFMTQQTVMM